MARPHTGRGKRIAGGLPLLLAVAALAALAGLLFALEARLAARGIPFGYGFLLDRAGFELGESLFPFQAEDPLWLAFLAGLANTLRVALPALAATLVVGVLVAIARLWPHRGLNLLGGAWVETLRNLPLLLHLLAWYVVLTEILPSASAALSLGEVVFLSKSGLSLPWPAHGLWLEFPTRGPFAITGGAALTPEYLAVFLALVTYTSAYVAETLRGALLAVPPGQGEAAAALGLTPWQSLRRVILPQALPTLLPPLANHGINLIKNSSLAVAVGYPDLVSVATTGLNQNGRALECLSIMAALYLALSLAVSLGVRHLEARSDRGAQAARASHPAQPS